MLGVFGDLKTKGFRAITEFGKSIYGKARTWLDRIVNYAKSIPGKVASALSSIPSLISGAISGAAGRVGGAIKGFFGGAEGAIVTRPTFTLVGEAGPEIIAPLHTAAGAMPLSAAGSAGSGGLTMVVEGDVYGIDQFEDYYYRLAEEGKRRGIE